MREVANTAAENGVYYWNGVDEVPKDVINVVINDGVAEVPSRTFVFCKSLQSVEIPSSVKAIGRRAFGDCYSLINVQIPDSVVTIEERAFEACCSLESLRLSDNIVIIEHATFEGCIALKSVKFGDSLKRIGNRAFKNCVSLQSISIPNSVEIIDFYAFYKCENLTTVNISDTIPYIRDSAFDSTPVASEFARHYDIIPRRMLDSVNVFHYNGEGEIPEDVTTLIVDEGVTYIGIDKCYRRELLTSVELPDSLKSIEMSAFSYCRNLSKIHIPDSVEHISLQAFSGCTSLTSINIPDAIKYIGGGAFCGCTSLESVKLPHSLEYLEYMDLDAFEHTPINIQDTELGQAVTTFSKAEILTLLNAYGVDAALHRYEVKLTRHGRRKTFVVEWEGDVLAAWALSRFYNIDTDIDVMSEFIAQKLKGRVKKRQEHAIQDAIKEFKQYSIRCGRESIEPGADRLISVVNLDTGKKLV